MLFLSLFFCGCNNSQMRVRSEVRRMVGKKLDLNFDVTEISRDTICYHAQLPDNCVRVVSFLSKTDCSKCMLNLTPIMNGIVDSMSKIEETSLLILTNSDDTLFLQKTLKELQLCNSIYSDVNDEYLNRNKLNNLLARNRTFLIDKHGKILVVGEPCFNVKIKELYYKVVLNL